MSRWHDQYLPMNMYSYAYIHFQWFRLPSVRPWTSINVLRIANENWLCDNRMALYCLAVERYDINANCSVLAICSCIKRVTWYSMVFWRRYIRKLDFILLNRLPHAGLRFVFNLALLTAYELSTVCAHNTDLTIVDRSLLLRERSCTMCMYTVCSKFRLARH
jgi:hypothetical protein